MYFKHVTLAVACVGMTMAACKKEQKPSVSETLKAENDNIQLFFDANRLSSRLSFTVNPHTDVTLAMQDGTKLVITAESIRALDGATLTENVSIKLNKMYNRWNMLSNNWGTETGADDPATEGKPLETGGSFNIVMTTVSGAEVTIPNGGVTMIVPGALTGGLNPDMTLWDGAQSPDQERDMLWIPDVTQIGISGSNYQIPNVRPRVLKNVDKPRQTKSSSGTLVPKVVLPTGHNTTNTEIFITMNNQLYTLASLDTYVPASASTNAYWTDNVGFMDEGQGGNIVVISMIGGSLHAKITPFTAAVDQVIIVQNVPSTTTSALRAAVMALN